MCLDFEVWSVDRFQDESVLPQPDRWAAEGDGWVFRTKNWQIVVEPSIEVDEHEPPPSISAGLVGIGYVTSVTLEPIHAPISAAAPARRVVRAIARHARGYGVDLQSETVIMAAGKTLRPKPGKDNSMDLLAMNWWFESGPLTSEPGFGQLLEYFETQLPQFMPRRYGSFEPPEYRFDRADRQPFLRFLFETPLFPIWKAEGPYFDVSFSGSRGANWERRPALPSWQYWVPHLTLSCPASLLDDSGWSRALRRCWQYVSQLARPFYGDVRFLRGYVARGRSLYVDDQVTESHPLRGPWRGLPPDLGCAAVFGPPYVKLAPGIVAAADFIDGLAFVSQEDWRADGDITDLVGKPPEELCQPGQDRRIERIHRFETGGGARSWSTERAQGRAPLWPFGQPPS